MSDKTVSFPIRLPASVVSSLKTLGAECGVSDQDIMRLALRIGLVDLRSLGKDQAQLIKEAADDAGTSFAAWAKQKTKPTPKKTASPEKLSPQRGDFEVKGILGSKDLQPSTKDIAASRLNEATEEQSEVEQLRRRLDELTKEDSESR